MALYILDSKHPKKEFASTAEAEGKDVRVLLYDNVSELTGAELTTVNRGAVICEVGSIAFKSPMTDMKQLGSDGAWG